MSNFLKIVNGEPRGTTIVDSDLPTITLTSDVTGSGSAGSIATTVAKIQGTAVSGTTGTVNVVFSASPTFTGTITAAAANFSGAISASNLSGTNSGDVTLAAVGSSPSANGASLSVQVLTLQPADATHPGLLTALTQSIGGTKTFSANATFSALLIANDGITTGTGVNLVINNGDQTHFTQVIGGNTIGTDPAITLYSSGNASAGIVTIDSSDIKLRSVSGSTALEVTGGNTDIYGTLTVGAASTTNGKVILLNSTNGQNTTIQSLDPTNSYNFNLPIAQGSSGQFLTSQGGGSTSMIWTTPSATPTLTSLGIFSGRTSLSNGATSASPTFSTAFATSTDYSVSATLYSADANPQFQPITISSQTTTGFSAVWNVGVPTANYFLLWQAILLN